MIGLAITGAVFIAFIAISAHVVHRLMESGRPRGIAWSALGVMVGSLAVTFIGAWASSTFPSA